MHMQVSIYSVSRELVAPVVCDYVFWILCEAQKRGITTLYFLARDGYTLKKIAEIICEKRKISVECRYLYCSRASLRMPSYNILGDEMYDLIFQGGYHVTLRSFFERAGISQDKWPEILKEVGIDIATEINHELAYGEISDYKERFKRSNMFRAQVLKNSQSAYSDAIGYFRQEYLLNQKHIAIIDSGWTGSMQRSIRQLLESAGFRGKITGFYFGLYVCPQDPADGEYLSWYFSGNSAKKNKIFFCNNLFECILSAPHGMTLRYEKKEDYVPVLLPPPEEKQLQKINDQIAGLLDGARERMEKGMTASRSKSERTLRSIMGRPSKELAELYGEFAFCDDITENYHFSLADAKQQDRLKDYLIIPRVLRKLSHKAQGKRAPELFWPYGDAAFISNPIKRAWYWGNIYLWEWLKYTLK